MAHFKSAFPGFEEARWVGRAQGFREILLRYRIVLVVENYLPIELHDPRLETGGESFGGSKSRRIFGQCCRSVGVEGYLIVQPLPSFNRKYCTC